MTRKEETPAGFDRPALESEGEYQDRAICYNGRHQRETTVSKSFVDAKESDIDHEDRDFGASNGREIQ